MYPVVQGLRWYLIRVSLDECCLLIACTAPDWNKLIGILNVIEAIHPQKSRPIATYLLENAVVRNGLPDHRAEILGLEAGQVNEGKEVGGVSTR